MEVKVEYRNHTIIVRETVNQQVVVGIEPGDTEAGVFDELSSKEKNAQAMLWAAIEHLNHRLKIQPAAQKLTAVLEGFLDEGLSHSEIQAAIGYAILLGDRLEGIQSLGDWALDSVQDVKVKHD